MNSTRLKRRIFILCWCAYAGAYLCRTNLSIVVPFLIEDLGWDKGTVGLLGSIFFWVYAFGQLINGYIGDRINTKLFIFFSLLLSSVINIVLGFVVSKFIFTILWGVNGFLLSMLWGPIIRILGLWFPKEESNKIGVGISTSMFAGYLVYWGPIGQFIRNTNWRLAFYIPGILVALFSLCWLIALPSKEEKIDRESGRIPVKQLLSPGLIFIALTCMAQGTIKESIGLWTPTILSDTARSIPDFTMFIPIMGFSGLLSAGWLNYRFNHREEFTVLLLFSLTLISNILLFLLLGLNVYLTICLLGVSLAILYGANALLLANIPLRFVAYGGGSTVAGFLDFSSYTGSAIASIITGNLATNFSWRSVVLLWCIASLAGILSVYLSQKNIKSQT
ncbi:MAG TPA: MFS transporter [bacterium]|nr:MFS transporter [bacterium]HOP55708.1 MFS transporter [bacterium]HPC77452.1 MFS transporter [bacterium]HRR90676.1 MFS transporter [bacterium]HRU32284.1 MFS transporter [bacterium]